VFTLGLQSFRTEYGLETLLEKSDEISVLETDMQLIGNQHSLRTWVGPTEDIRVFALEMQPICAEYKPNT